MMRYRHAICIHHDTFMALFPPHQDGANRVNEEIMQRRLFIGRLNSQIRVILHQRSCYLTISPLC